MMTHFRPLAVVAAALPLALACAPPPTSDDGSFDIVTTTGMIADAAKRIAGDAATVTALMGPGIDPHLYKASESDVRRLAQADLILFHGLYLEGAMNDILHKIGRTRPSVAVAESIPEERLILLTGANYEHDPHVWFDVGLWREVLAPIVDALSTELPEHAERFRANAAAFAEELETLDAWTEERFASIPEDLRILVTAHDAFGYMGRRYGLDVVGIQGVSTASEAGLKDLERVIELVVENQIPAVFVESSVSQRSVEALQAGARSRGHDVRIGGSLFSDAMGAEGTPEGTYPGMVRHNVNTIVEALQ